MYHGYTHKQLLPVHVCTYSDWEKEEEEEKKSFATTTNFFERREGGGPYLETHRIKIFYFAALSLSLPGTTISI